MYFQRMLLIVKYSVQELTQVNLCPNENNTLYALAVYYDVTYTVICYYKNNNVQTTKTAK